MKIKIESTNEIREIEIVDYNSERDCLDDVIANCGESYEWDDEVGGYIMPLDAADWWTEYADGHAETEAEINRLWEIIDGLTTEQQQEVLPNQQSEVWRADVANYVYQDHHDDLSDERTLAEARIRELETAITYSQQDSDLWAVKPREGWEHPEALYTVTSGRYTGWVIVPVAGVTPGATGDDLEADPGVIRYVTCRTIDPSHGRGTDYYPPEDSHGYAIRF